MSATYDTTEDARRRFDALEKQMDTRRRFDAICQLLTEIVAELKRGNSIERTGAVSSVKITLQRGTVDITCHAYTGSDITDAEAEALASFERVKAQLNQQGVDAIASTVKQLRGEG